jgi:hypothetical protein
VSARSIRSARPRPGLAPAWPAKLVNTVTLKVYPGAAPGMCVTEADKVNPDLPVFFTARPAT